MGDNQPHSIEGLENKTAMKKEGVMDILQNEFVFDRQSVPDLSLRLTGISELGSSTLNIECKATPAIPDGFCINARIKVHAYGYDCNPGYKLSCCGKCADGHHVTFTLQDYRRSFNIGTLDRREVFVRMEYDLVDMQSGFHRTNKKVLSTKVMSKNDTISERFE